MKKIYRLVLVVLLALPFAASLYAADIEYREDKSSVEFSNTKETVEHSHQGDAADYADKKETVEHSHQGDAADYANKKETVRHSHTEGEGQIID